MSSMGRADIPELIENHIVDPTRLASWAYLKQPYSRIVLDYAKLPFVFTDIAVGHQLEFKCHSCIFYFVWFMADSPPSPDRISKQSTDRC
jgi:hypothetical protein